MDEAERFTVPCFSCLGPFGKPVFVYNFFNFERFRWEGQAALTPGKHTVVFDFKYDGPGFGKGANVVNGYSWELYNIAEDYSEYNDLAAKMPDRLRNMQELFLVEAEKYDVFPLDNSFSARAATPRPSATAGRTVFTYSGESSGLPYSDAPDITAKSYSITAEVEIPQGGAEGMINTLGGRAGGHGLYLLKGKPVFVYNFFDLERFRWEGPAALTPGKHTVVFDFKYDGPGFGKGVQSVH